MRASAPAPAGSGDGPRLRPDPLRDPWAPAMRLALAEADLALPTDDVPVGALVLDPSGAVLGRGHNEREAVGDPTAHAEVLAIRDAARTLRRDGGARDWRLTGCTLVVTLEPCTMCAGAIVLSRLARVVYGAWDDKAGAAGSLWDVIRDRRLNHRPEVVPGVLAADCATALTAFFDARRAADPSEESV
ncbi:nucleoside deaminase [Streptacidiphilus cavernicola]|uniref:tRNA-specific adenosine deaminase n=1 Tax=Streptacidiphilus cavernicola TaxID=3342716 RepID=A0ABV6VVR1_9ACTN